MIVALKRRLRPRARSAGLRLASAVAIMSLAILFAGRAAAEEPPVAILAFEHQRVGEGIVQLDFLLDREPIYSLFTLTDPYRLVLDLPLFDWRAPRPEPGAVAGLADIRTGLFRHGRGRIVLELEGPMALEEAHTAYRPGTGRVRLSLRLAPTGPQAFAATAGWPSGARWTPEAGGASAAPGDVIVAIDPGHGGTDPGAVREGMMEKDIVLEFAGLLASAVDRIDGVRAVLTRTDDRFVPLRSRTRIAKAAGAHAFVSLHADSLEAGGADGLSIYTLSAIGRRSAEDAFATEENRADILAGVNLSGAEDDVARLVIGLARRATLDESRKLATHMLEALGSRVDLLDTRPHRVGNFYVLKAPDLPAVLVELGFLSSEEDRERLVDPAWRARTMAGLAEGIAEWIDQASPAMLGRRQ